MSKSDLSHLGPSGLARRFMDSPEPTGPAPKPRLVKLTLPEGPVEPTPDGSQPFDKKAYMRAYMAGKRRDPKP